MLETSYFDSAFLKRPNSQNLHDKLLESLTALDLGKLVQILMDGLNVNWDVLSLHSSYREKNEFSGLINIGSCGLHVLHSALQTRIMETDWKVNKVLHAMWKIFDGSPARRDIHIMETGCDIFPSHFCKTRWVEDEPVAARGIQMVVKYWRSLRKSKHSRNNKSFDTLVKFHTDKLMVPKLNFFKYIASILRPYLLRFQTSKPMIPFLAVEPDVTPRQLTSLVVKNEVVSDANIPYLLLKLDLGKKENLCNIDNVELHSAVTSALRKKSS